MCSNPYKEFFEAATSGDEYAGLRQEEARKRIEKIRETASLNGMSEEAVIRQQSNEMGG
jgi:hypothetical protein